MLDRTDLNGEADDLSPRQAQTREIKKAPKWGLILKPAIKLIVLKKRAMGLEPMTFSLARRRSTN